MFLDKLKARLNEIKTAASDIAQGQYADDVTHQKRIEICNACEHLFAPTRNCLKCGCFVDVKTKLEHSNCPIDKW